MENEKKFYENQNNAGLLPVFNGILLLGVILAVVGFVLLLPKYAGFGVFWLGFAVILAMLVLNMGFLQFVYLEIRDKKKDFSSFVVAGGIIWGYDALAAILVIMSIFIPLPFAFYLVSQFALVFIMVLALALSGGLNRFADSVGKEQKEMGRGTQALKDKASALLLKLEGLQMNNGHSAVKSVLEDIRYISPSPLETARDLDVTIRAQLDTLSGLIGPETAPEALQAETDKLAALVRERKAVKA